MVRAVLNLMNAFYLQQTFSSSIFTSFPCSVTWRFCKCINTVHQVCLQLTHHLISDCPMKQAYRFATIFPLWTQILLCFMRITWNNIQLVTVESFDQHWKRKQIQLSLAHTLADVCQGIPQFHQMNSGIVSRQRSCPLPLPCSRKSTRRGM